MYVDWLLNLYTFDKEMFGRLALSMFLWNIRNNIAAI